MIQIRPVSDLRNKFPEIETIVNSGNKLNISYFIDEKLDDDEQEEIFDYFRNAENGSMEEAIKELCPDYTETEIRLVRIKFLSELGN